MTRQEIVAERERIVQELKAAQRVYEEAMRNLRQQCEHSRTTFAHERLDYNCVDCGKRFAWDRY